MSESKNIFGKGRHTLIRGNSSSSENVSYRKIRFIRILGLGLGLCLLSLSFLLVSVHANPIIRITPKTLTNSTYSLGFSTYFGGTGWDQGQSIAVDSANNSYITGWTASNSAFPLKNAYQTTFGKGGTDAFVAKFDPTGNLVFSTYLGGNGNDKGYAIAVDSVGNSYVTGITNSNDFPLKNAYNKTYGGAFSSLGGDVFVAKFDPAGALVFSTYLGGSGDDYGVGIAVDSANNSYITGHTDSSTFPMKNAYNKTYGGGIDAFVAKFNATGSLVFSTFLGGSNSDFGTSIAVDNAGNSYVVGGTVYGNYPMMNAYQPTYGGAGPYNQGDAFIAKFNATGNGLVFSTYLGGSGDDVGCGIAVDSDGNSKINGYTASGKFPRIIA